MRPREVLATAAGAAAAVHLWPHNALAQTRPGQPHIGVLCPTTCVGPALDAFRSALGEQGRREGQTVTLIYREAEGQLHRLPSLARELVERKVDVLFSSWGTAAPLALKQATTTIPIVAGAVGDPLAAGLVDSLAKPGGNVTGFSTLALVLEGKRLELLREIEPRIVRIAVLWDPDNPYSSLAFSELESAAKPLGMRLMPVRVVRPQDLDAAFATIAVQRPDALLVPAYLVLVTERARIAAFAAASRLPAVYSQDEFVAVGGLASYGVDLPRLAARAASYVDRILKGTNPADLPVEQPTLFRMTINLKAAKALGLTISPTLLARADEVIE
jgi:putative tryptophan/tyrosine transport system substrate-binding protein